MDHPTEPIHSFSSGRAKQCRRAVAATAARDGRDGGHAKHLLLLLFLLPLVESQDKQIWQLEEQDSKLRLLPLGGATRAREGIAADWLEWSSSSTSLKAYLNADDDPP